MISELRSTEGKIMPSWVPLAYYRTTTLPCCRRESGEVRKMMSELETRNRLLTTNLQQSETSYQAKLQAAENRLQQVGSGLQGGRGGGGGGGFLCALRLLTTILQQTKMSIRSSALPHN